MSSKNGLSLQPKTELQMKAYKAPYIKFNAVKAANIITGSASGEIDPWQSNLRNVTDEEDSLIFFRYRTKG